MANQTVFRNGLISLKDATINTTLHVDGITTLDGGAVINNNLIVNSVSTFNNPVVMNDDLSLLGNIIDSSDSIGTSGMLLTPHINSASGTTWTNLSTLVNDYGITKYSLIIRRSDVSWVNGWINVDYDGIGGTGGTHAYSIFLKDVSLYVSVGYGTIKLTPIIRYPGPDINNGDYPHNICIKDQEGILTENSDFDYIRLYYNYTSDAIENGKFDAFKLVLGENVVSDHSLGDETHDRIISNAFLAQFPEFTDILYHTTTDILTTGSLDELYESTYCSIRGVNLILKPYVGSAITDNVYSNPNLLHISAHYGNTFERHDITINSTTFMSNSIAVGGRTDDIVNTIGCTSYGFGMEFFEVNNNAWLNNEYPTYFDPLLLNNASIDETGYYVTTSLITLYNNFNNMWDCGPGYKITLETLNHSHSEIRTIDYIVSDGVLKVTEPFSVLYFYSSGFTGSTQQNYMYLTEARIGTWCDRRLFTDYPANTYSTAYSNSESMSVAIVGSKIKEIRARTKVSWNIVRIAARMTASNSVYSNGVWTTNWDMYRGFGIINVEAAITYINDNYLYNMEYRNQIANDLEGLKGINSIIQYDDLLNNSPVSKRMISEKITNYYKDVQINESVNSGSTNIISTVLASVCNGIYFDFVVSKNENVKVGTIIVATDTVQIIDYTEFSTTEVGTTSDVSLSVDIFNGYVRLVATTTTNGWNIKSLARIL